MHPFHPHLLSRPLHPFPEFGVGVPMQMCTSYLDWVAARLERWDGLREWVALEDSQDELIALVQGLIVIFNRRCEFHRETQFTEACVECPEVCVCVCNRDCTLVVR